ncbi:MAG: hypothetical protein AABX51_06235 [Nanoarchaeota archaeon]
MNIFPRYPKWGVFLFILGLFLMAIPFAVGFGASMRGESISFFSSALMLLSFGIGILITLPFLAVIFSVGMILDPTKSNYLTIIFFLFVLMGMFINFHYISLIISVIEKIRDKFVGGKSDKIEKTRKNYKIKSYKKSIKKK